MLEVRMPCGAPTHGSSRSSSKGGSCKLGVSGLEVDPVLDTSKENAKHPVQGMVLLGLGIQELAV